MLLDLKGNVLINPIDQTHITDKWKEYLKFKKKPHLSRFPKQELLQRVSAVNNRVYQLSTLPC